MPTGFFRSNHLATGALSVAMCCLPLSANPGDPATVLSEAEASLSAGRLVEAEARLESLDLATLTDVSAADRRRLARLMQRVGEELRAADPIDISLQRARLAFSEGELIQAERHARALVSREHVDLDRASEAADILRRIRARRAELAPMIADAIKQAERDFKAGRHDESMTGLGVVLRSGVELTDGQRVRLDKLQLALIDVNASDLGVGAAGVFQPGRVRRSDDPAIEEITPDQPEEEPAEESDDDDFFEVDPEEDVEFIDLDAMEEQADTAVEELTGSVEAVDIEPIVIDVQPANVGMQPADEVIELSQPDAFEVDDSGVQGLMDRAMRADALRLLAEADQAFDQNRLQEAIRKYEVVLDRFGQYLNEDQVAGARRRVDDARARLRSNLPGDLQQTVVRDAELNREIARTEFSNDVARINEALSRDQMQDARATLARARFAINNRRQYFNDQEFNDFISQLDRLTAEVEAKEVRLARDTAEAEDRARLIAAENQERSAEQEKTQKILALIDRARALQAEQKYADSLEVVDQLLFLDPRNPTGLLLHDIISDILIYQRYLSIQDDKQYGHAVLTLDNEEATIPPRPLMDYPDDWPERTFRRGEQSAYADPPENRRALAELDRSRVPANFDDHALADVLRFIETVAGVEMDVDWASLEEIGVDEDTLVTMQFSQITAKSLLDRVMEKVSGDSIGEGAGWAVNDGIVLVASDEALRRNKTLVIYNITDLLFEIPDYDEAPEIDLQSVLQQGEGGQGQSPFEDNEDEDEEDIPREERIQRIIDIVQEIVDPLGWIDAGGETGSILELNGSLIITNTPKNHREIVGLLSKLREIRSMQINVETRFLLVNQDWFEQIGFDIDVVFNANNNQVRAARGLVDRVQPGDFFDFTGQGLVRGVNVFDADVNADNDIADAGEALGGPLPLTNPTAFSPIGLGQGSLDLASTLAAGASGFAQSILSGAPALGIAGQFLDDIQVDFLIQATQADQRTVQLTAPRLTFTNGQTANIFVVTQQAFISDLEPVVADSAVGFDPDVAAVSEGVVMLVEGVISADRRYVTMNVDAGIARIDDFGEEPVSAVAGGQLVSSDSVQSFIQLPQVTVTRVRTTVTVPDEGTVLLGGQRLITELEVETGVPVLSKLPIINRFFTNRVESKEEQTLMILVKPTILIQTEQEERAHPGVLDAVRIGSFP